MFRLALFLFSFPAICLCSDQPIPKSCIRKTKHKAYYFKEGDGIALYNGEFCIYISSSSHKNDTKDVVHTRVLRSSWKGIYFRKDDIRHIEHIPRIDKPFPHSTVPARDPYNELELN
jgi:hypothetical protein